MSIDVEITLQVILEKPTLHVIFGLQKGSGNNYETVQKQIASSGDLSFTFPVKIKGDRATNMQPKFSGAFVQGPANSQFIYIDIGTYAGQFDSIWSRRLKVPLTGISWKDIDSLLSKDFILQTRVPGTGKDGGPNCATVKPFGGWYIKQTLGT